MHPAGISKHFEDQCQIISCAGLTRHMHEGYQKVQAQSASLHQACHIILAIWVLHGLIADEVKAFHRFNDFIS